jgi:hypothetical protein
VAVEHQGAIGQVELETLLEPQLTQGQYLFISEKGQDRGEAYGLQERDGITVYASLKIIGDHFRLHLIVWNQRAEAVAWDKETVLLTSEDGEPFQFRLVGEGFLDGLIQPEETAGGKMYFWYASSREPAAILTLSLEQEKLSFRFGLPAPGSQKLTPDQQMFEAWLRDKQLPVAAYRNPNCLCLECAGRLWSPNCTRPYNTLRPHEGPCPYCGAALSSSPAQKDWWPYWDSLHTVLGHTNLRWCENCKHSL